MAQRSGTKQLTKAALLKLAADESDTARAAHLRRLADGVEPLKALTIKPDQKRKKREELIKGLPPVKPVIEKHDGPREPHSNDIAVLQKQVDDLRKQIDDLKADAVELSGQLEASKKALEEAGEQHEKQLEEREAAHSDALAGRDKTIAERDTSIAELTSAVEVREDAIETGKAAIESATKSLEAKDAETAKLQGFIAERDEEIVALKKALDEAKAVDADNSEADELFD